MKFIKYVDRSAESTQAFGELPEIEISNRLKQFRGKAIALLHDTNADHIIYGRKIFSEDGQLSEVRFYMLPLCDKDFCETVNRCPGDMFYCVHRNGGII